MNTKIATDYDCIADLVRTYRRQKRTIVLTQGSFDMLHIGHGRYLHQAKKQGDILIVGVDSDVKIRQRKGPGRPVVPQAERLEMLAYMASVDHVVIKEIDQPRWQLIKTVKPDVLIATAGTYSDQDLEQLKQWCKKVKVLEPQATTSTSAKLRRLQISFAHDFTARLTPKIQQAIQKVLQELEK